MNLKLKIKDIVSANIVTKSLCCNCYEVRIEGVLKDDGNIDYYILHVGDTSASDGITPTGTINLTDSSKIYDVTEYAYAKILDSNLIPSNIKKGITILGVTGTHEGSGDDNNGDDNAGEETEVVTTINLHTAEGTVTKTTKAETPYIEIQNDVLMVYYNDGLLYSASQGMKGISLADDNSIDSGDLAVVSDSTPARMTLEAGKTYELYVVYAIDEECKHENVTYRQEKAGYHIVTCTDCGETWEEECTDDGGVCSKCYGNPTANEQTTTVIVAGYVMETKASDPILTVDGGSGTFCLRSASNDKDEVTYCPTDTYGGEGIPLLGAPAIGEPLTPGETYYYTYFHYDGSDQFAVMINYKGNITWEKAYAGDFNISWNGNGSVSIGGTSYSCDGLFLGLSVADDNNVTSDGDIPYGTDVNIGGTSGNTYDNNRSYVYYLYEAVGTKTTLSLYRPSGTYIGKLSTLAENPQMTMTREDSGEIYLTDAFGGNWGDGKALHVSLSGDYPAGLSLANDGNITSTGDIEWVEGKTISLTAGEEHTYYVLHPSDIVEETVTTTLIIYRANGSLMGKLTTTDPEPYLYFAYNDSGEVGITGGVPAESTGDYFSNGDILFQDGGGPMAGLSVSNDKNLTSTGDIVWTNNTDNPSYATGNKKQLTAGLTYTYYGYTNDDIETSGGDSGGSSGGTTTSYACPSCGVTMSVCPSCGATTCFNGACSNYIGDELYYIKPYCSTGCYQD